MARSFKVLSPTAILGYGFPEESFRKAMAESPDLIAVDAGSSDPGPHYLGAGKPFTDRAGVKRDLRYMITAGVQNNIPVVIGTAGGSGAAPHLEWCREIIHEIALEEQLAFSMALIPADVDKAIVHQALDNGKITALDFVPPLTHDAIDESTYIVAQMGIEPFQRIVLLDHAERDGLDGFITITGGKLMTYRLMAEWATDAVCRKLGNTRPCTTADLALPGSQEPAEVTLRKVISLPAPLRGSAVYRHGDRTPAWLSEGRLHRSLVCECEAVTAGEVQYAVENLNVNSLLDLRRRTRVGMGTPRPAVCRTVAGCRIGVVL